MHPCSAPPVAQEGRLLHPSVKAQPPHMLAQAGPAAAWTAHNGEKSATFACCQTTWGTARQGTVRAVRQNHQRNARINRSALAGKWLSGLNVWAKTAVTRPIIYSAPPYSGIPDKPSEIAHTVDISVQAGHISQQQGRRRFFRKAIDPSFRILFCPYCTMRSLIGKGFRRKREYSRFISQSCRLETLATTRAFL